MVQTGSLLTVAVVLGTANGFFLNPVQPAISQLRTTRGTRLSMSYDPSNNLKRASEEGAAALKKADLNANTEDQTKISAKSARVEAPNGVVAEKQVIREAPIVKERIHEKTTEVDKTRILEEKVRTEVVQRVQPIKEEQRQQEDVRRVDHGVEVREHGKSGLDQGALDELEKRRQEVVSKAGTTRDATTERISERPDVVQKERLQVVEQVVPVVERDVYVPHRVEHEKQVKEVYHEKPVVKQTVVEPAITKAEFEQKYGRKVDTVAADQKLSSEAHSSVDRATTTHSSTTNARAAAPQRAADSKVEHRDSAKAKVHATSEHKHSSSDGSHSDDSYSMSSSNMAREAAEGDATSSSGGGLGAAIKKPFKAVADLVEKIVE